MRSRRLSAIDKALLATRGKPPRPGIPPRFLRSKNLVGISPDIRKRLRGSEYTIQEKTGRAVAELFDKRGT